MENNRSDISKILEAWKYADGEHVRRVTTASGNDVLQVRLPLGIEQYELHVRPDGVQPNGEESWFQHYSHQAEKNPWDLELNQGDFQNLKEECLLYYYRYLLFFQLGEYDYCSRDTLRNIAVLDFVADRFSPELCSSLEQYRPYILRMHYMSDALGTIESGGEISEALQILSEGTGAIENLPEMGKNKIFLLEQKNSLRATDELRQQLIRMLPPDPLTKIRQKLAHAIENEDYEEAARLRDSLGSNEGRNETG